MDRETKYIVLGWTYVLLGSIIAVACVVTGLIYIGIIWIFVVAVGISVLIVTFWEFQVPFIPEYIEFWRNQWLVRSSQRSFSGF